MPFWHGEYMARSPHLAARIGAIRRDAAAAETPGEIAALASRNGADLATMRSIVSFVRAQRGSTGVVPDDQRLVVEQFPDEMGSIRAVVHSPFGARVNAPWGMALANRVREWLGTRAGQSRSDSSRDRPESGPIYELQVQTSDDGVMLRLPSLSKPLPLDVILGLSPDEALRRLTEEVGSSSLFGARFRMNAARALLLPRGNPRRRMPLWLQRLKALDLLQSVREHPSFPILVETYRDVLTSAFDMAGLEQVLSRIAREELSVHSVETRGPSPFAASLQFGFVMDWMYGDDAPRAEGRAARLSLDHALLDDLVGDRSLDAETLAMVDEITARRRGTAPGSRARGADDLAVLMDRAGDLTADEIIARIAIESDDHKSVANPFAELLADGRIVEVELPTDHGGERRFILTENVPRYLSAFGEELLATIRGGAGLVAAGADVIPAGFRQGSLTADAARHELLANQLSLAGALSVADVGHRYGFDVNWTEAQLIAWHRTGSVVRLRGDSDC
jgi:ATP-dependent Lhr-like helicase